MWRRARLLSFAGIVFKVAVMLAASQERLPTFEVASVKPSDPNKPTVQLRIGHGSYTVGDHVIGLIEFAFNLDRQMVEGGPTWIESEWWDIVAKGDTSAGPDQIKLMLQSLLAERFQLKFHREHNTVAGYALSVEPKKRMLAKKSAEKTPGMRVPGSAEGAPRIAPIVVGRNGIKAHGVSMQHLCSFLSVGVLRSPVIDNTGLDGIYDFELMYDDWDLGAANIEPSQYGDIFSALRGMGLRLTSAKVPVDVLHIDSVERPSGN
jgi:uncharacterized protein (TIGR03435 family)